MLSDYLVFPITGWLFTVMEKEGIRRGRKTVADYLETLVKNCACIDPDTARKAGLLMKKADRLCAFGGLKYPSKDFCIWFVP